MICGLVLLINCSFSPIVEHDLKTLELAKADGCSRFNPDMPCVVKFYKLGEFSFHATCGEEAGTSSDVIVKIEGPEAKAYCKKIGR